MYHFEFRPIRNSAKQWENFTPACEIQDEEKSFGISLDIPGLKQDEIEIEVKDNHLHISGERKDEGKAVRSEKRYGKFERVFTLPQNVNTDLIEARFENGVLDILLPKEEKSQAKKITINGLKKETETVN